MSPSELPFAEHLCKDAFEDYSDNLCAFRQVAALLGLDFGQVCNDFQAIERRWVPNSYQI